MKNKMLKKICLMAVSMAMPFTLFTGCANSNGGSSESSGTYEENSLSSAELFFSWDDVEESVIEENSWSPRVITLANGSMLCAVEKGDGIYVKISQDVGDTWSDSALASFAPDLACANPNLFQLKDGSILLSYRAVGDRDDGFYTSLRVSISADGGKTFSDHSLITEYVEPSHDTRGVWEPCLGYLNGVLTCFYANDLYSVTSQQNIEYLQYADGEWTNRTIVTNGEQNNSRDGMPVWIPLKDGGYVCVIEATHNRDAEGKHPFTIALVYSKDGVEWSKPYDIYIPTTPFSKAGAPCIAELPDGRIVVSFQTDEDKDEKGDQYSEMKTIMSNGGNVWELDTESFTESDIVFTTEQREGAIWTGIWFDGKMLFATAGTPRGSSMKKISID